MTFQQLLAWLPAIVAIAGVVGVVFLIRRYKPVGLAVWVSAPVSALSHVLARFGVWVGRGSDTMRAHADEEGGKVFVGSSHRLATGVMYVGLAGAWLGAMTLYVSRNTNIVLTEHNDAVRLGVAASDPTARIAALAEVFAPVLLTAAAGIVIIEVLGFTHHLPFLHRERRSQKIMLATFALGVLGAAMVMQMSVARQEAAISYNTVIETVEQRRANTIPPLPLQPTSVEVQNFKRLTAEFDQQIVTPALVAYQSTVGPFGWRTWLPIGAALLDFVFAFSLVPAIVVCWALLMRITAAGTEMVRATANGAAFLVRMIGGAVVTMLGLTAPEPVPAVPPASEGAGGISRGATPTPAHPGRPSSNPRPTDGRSASDGPNTTTPPAEPAHASTPRRAATPDIEPAWARRDRVSPPWASAHWPAPEPLSVEASATSPIAPGPAEPTVDRWNPPFRSRPTRP